MSHRMHASRTEAWQLALFLGLGFRVESLGARTYTLAELSTYFSPLHILLLPCLSLASRELRGLSGP